MRERPGRSGKSRRDDPALRFFEKALSIASYAPGLHEVARTFAAAGAAPLAPT
jgi:hypothetical protein